MASDENSARRSSGNPDNRIVLTVPYGNGGTRKACLVLPPDVAAWLRDQLIEAVGPPRPRQPRRRRAFTRPYEPVSAAE
jgi:hypothetical protein